MSKIKRNNKNIEDRDGPDMFTARSESTGSVSFILY